MPGEAEGNGAAGAAGTWRGGAKGKEEASPGVRGKVEELALNRDQFSRVIKVVAVKIPAKRTRCKHVR